MTTAKDTNSAYPTNSPQADECWQEYLDELRMLDDGCPNCEPAPAMPTLPPRREANGKDAPTIVRWRVKWIRRWPKKMVSEIVEVLVKLAVASLFT